MDTNTGAGAGAGGNGSTAAKGHLMQKQTKAHAKPSIETASTLNDDNLMFMASYLMKEVQRGL
jgi:hypothetical protein